MCLGYGLWRQQVIIWANVDPDLRHHKAPLGNNVLIKTDFTICLPIRLYVLHRYLAFRMFQLMCEQLR